MGNNILGTKESVEHFTKKHLVAFVSNYFTADNLVVSYVGNLAYPKLEKLLLASLQEMPLKGKREIPIDFNTYIPFKKRSKEANFQSHAVLGGLAPSYKSDDRMAMSLLINILGGPALNSRLNLSVREKYGLAYSVEASYNTFADTGFWQIYVGSEAKNMNKAIDLIYKELQVFQTKELSSLQLQRAKAQLKGHLALGMDSNAGLMQGLGKSLLAFNQIDTLAEIHHGIDKISSSQLLEISQKYFKKELLSELVFDLADA